MSADPKTRAERLDDLSRTLAQMDPASRDLLLANVAREDPELAIDLRKKLFLFEDLLQFEDRTLQQVLTAVKDHTLALALKTASPELAEALRKNLPARRAQALQEVCDSLGKRRLSEVIEAQAEIVRVATPFRD